MTIMHKSQRLTLLVVAPTLGQCPDHDYAFIVSTWVCVCNIKIYCINPRAAVTTAAYAFSGNLINLHKWRALPLRLRKCAGEEAVGRMCCWFHTIVWKTIFMMGQEDYVLNETVVEGQLSWDCGGNFEDNVIKLVINKLDLIKIQTWITHHYVILLFYLGIHSLF